MKFAKLIFTYREWTIFLGCIFIFLLLLFKDPFSQRTLIPNFEPHPDTFYYINPALALMRGEGFNISRGGRIYNANASPLYSFTLVPSFIIKDDPRMAYYTNLALAFVSLFIFWLILKKIFTNRITKYALLILYITNFYIYWVPSLIMAENLNLTLFLAVILILLSKISIINLIAMAFLAISLYATKYADIPITVTIFFTYSAKILFSKFSLREKICSAAIFSGALIAFFLILTGFEWISRGRNLLAPILYNFSLIYQSVPVSNQIIDEGPKANSFSIRYISQQLPNYINSLIGRPNRFLWDYTPIVPNFIGIGAITGFLITVFNKRFRFISLSLSLLTGSLVIFMSTFYSFDARYIYLVIPVLIIGFGLFLTGLENQIPIDKKNILKFAILIFMLVYLLTNFIRIKNQISLNLRHAETPWYYIAVLKMNEVFTPEKITDGKKPILISALAPFLIDYYSNGNYTLLPLSYDQEFRGQDVREIVWGPNDYSNLPKLYTKYLNEGYDVYVSRSGLGNEVYTNRDFDVIINEFDVKLVQPGCYDQCNIYRVRLK